MALSGAGRYKWRTLVSRWVITSAALGPEKWELPGNSVSSDVLFEHVVSVNQYKTSLVIIPWVEVLRLMGVRSQIENLPGLDEDEKLAGTYFSSDKKRLGSLWDWWTFGEPGGVYSVFILEDVASDKRLDVTSVISSAVPFKIVLPENSC